ncbi:MAG: hypothetical protein AAFV98_17480 [Chloroflexota bacterium]
MTTLPINQERVRPGSFIFVFTLAYFLISSLIHQVYMDIWLAGDSGWGLIGNTISLTLIQFIFSICQALLLKWQFNWSAVLWIVASLILVIFQTAISLFLAEVLTTQQYIAWQWGIFAVTAFITFITYYFVLKRYIRQAWIYLFVIVAGGLLAGVVRDLLRPVLNVSNDVEWQVAVEFIVQDTFSGFYTALMFTLLVRMLGRDDIAQKPKSVYDDVQDASPVSGM